MKTKFLHMLFMGACIASTCASEPCSGIAIQNLTKKEQGPYTLFLTFNWLEGSGEHKKDPNPDEKKKVEALTQALAEIKSRSNSWSTPIPPISWGQGTSIPLDQGYVEAAVGVCKVALEIPEYAEKIRPQLVLSVDGETLHDADPLAKVFALWLPRDCAKVKLLNQGIIQLRAPLYRTRFIAGA